MLAKVAGSNQFKVGNGKATWSELPWSIDISNYISSSGSVQLVDNHLEVNFSQMPTDKFEALLKSIYIPILLKANKNFYVNGSAGSDVLSEGRGESEGKPFKTIQAAVDYVTQNYNFSKYNIAIQISSGTYSPFSIGSYTNAGGTLSIQGDKSSKPIILAENTTCVKITSAYVNLLDLVLKVKTRKSTTSGIAVNYCLRATSQSTVSCGGIDFYLSHETSEGNSTNNDIVIEASAYSTVTLGYSTISTANWHNSIEFHKGNYGNITVIYTTSNGIIYLAGSKVSQQNATCDVSGECSTFAAAENKGLISISGTYEIKFNFKIVEGFSVTGKRYSAAGGGTINVKGGGPEFFPGTTAGTVDSATYSWYA